MVTPQQSKTNSPFDNPDEFIGNTSKKSRLKWWVLLVLLLSLGVWTSVYAGGGVKNVMNKFGIQGVPGPAGEAGLNGIDGKNGIDGVSTFSSATTGTSGTTGQNGADGATGATGADGAAGAAGTNGTNGADGAPGSNDCISGICVSRQVGSPGTQEVGNINIDGKMLATQVGINDTTPSNTLTVGGTVDVSGHSAFGGETVDGYTSGSDGLSGTSSNSTTMIVHEELTSITGSGMNRQAFAAGLVLNPGAAPVYNQINGVGGGVEIASGNTQNFTGNLSGYGGGFIHSGSGTVSNAASFNAGMLNLSTGTISIANAFNSNVINLNAGGTVTNAHGLQANVINLGTITNNYGVKINTPTNGGTVTNNYGLYVADQSSVGSTITQNIYSAGLTSNNFFQGFVGIGSIAGALDGQVHIVNDGSGNSFKVSDTAYADTSPFVIDSDGDVGIGTATPGVKLDVNGVIRGTRFSGVSGSTTWLSSDGSGTGLFVTDSANPQTGANRSFHITANGGQAVPAFSVTGGSTGQIVALVKGAASQTANLQEWQNSSSSPLSVVDESGYLGIGTSNPSAELDISQNATWITEMLLTHTTSGKTITMGTTGNATSSWNIHNAYGELFFYNTSLSEPSLELADNGSVGIGTNFSAPGAKLHIKDSSGDTNVLRIQDTDGTCDHNPESGSETVSCSSDARLKTDITDAASVLSEINGLRIRDYTVIASGSQTTGLIAQEVLETNPEMVHMGEDGYYKVDSYNPWKVLKGIQELSLNVDTLGVDFAGALEQTQGDIDGATELLASQGLQLNQLSETLQDYASKLAEHDQLLEAQGNKINELEQRLEQYEQQNSSTPPPNH